MGSKQSVEKKLENAPTVLIVGGGYGGCQLAKSLDTDMNVILVDRKQYFHHNIGALRSAVNETFMPASLIPYTDLLKHGHFIQAEVEKIDPTQGVFFTGKEEPVKFDYLAIATGSSYAFPMKVALPNVEGVTEQLKKLQAIIAKRENILIVGGGPVGVELTGEIKYLYPNKNVTLVHSRERLLNQYGFGKKFEDQIHAKLEKLNVKIVVNDRIKMDQYVQVSKQYLEGERTVTTQNGEELQTDLIFWTIGAKTNTKSFEKELPLNDQKRLDINEFHQVQGYNNIFGLGDCAGHWTKMAYFAGEQAKVVAHNIRSVHAENPKKMKTWKPLMDVMAVPIGPTQGVTKMGPLGVYGNFTTKKMKGQDLFTTNNWNLLGFKSVPYELQQFEVEREDEDSAKIAKALKTTDEDAKEFLLNFGAQSVVQGEETDHGFVCPTCGEAGVFLNDTEDGFDACIECFASLDEDALAEAMKSDRTRKI